jgi:hypothetical protein
LSFIFYIFSARSTSYSFTIKRDVLHNINISFIRFFCAFSTFHGNKSCRRFADTLTVKKRGEGDADGSEAKLFWWGERGEGREQRSKSFRVEYADFVEARNTWRLVVTHSQKSFVLRLEKLDSTVVHAIRYFFRFDSPLLIKTTLPKSTEIPRKRSQTSSQTQKRHET